MVFKALVGIFLALVFYRYAFAGIGVEAGAFLESWTKANHWAGLTAGTIAVNLAIAVGRMKPLSNPDASKGRILVMLAISFVMICFLAYEYWFVVEAAGEGVLTLVVLVVGKLNEFLEWVIEWLG